MELYESLGERQAQAGTLPGLPTLARLGEFLEYAGLVRQVDPDPGVLTATWTYLEGGPSQSNSVDRLV